MKKNIFLWIILISAIGINFSIYGEPKYYEIKSKTPSEEKDWRDISFVVKVSDPNTQADFEQELALDWESRFKIVSGALGEGSGGFNRNGSHCFNWHMIDETVHLTEVTTEVCDGKPYQDCELGNFVDIVGFFCPWKMSVWAEIPAPQECSMSIDNDIYSDIHIYPNPFQDKLYLDIDPNHKESEITIYNSLGLLVFERKFNTTINEINLNELNSGIYFLTVKTGDYQYQKRIVKH